MRYRYKFYIGSMGAEECFSVKAYSWYQAIKICLRKAASRVDGFHYGFNIGNGRKFRSYEYMGGRYYHDLEFSKLRIKRGLRAYGLRAKRNQEDGLDD